MNRRMGLALFLLEIFLSTVEEAAAPAAPLRLPPTERYDALILEYSQAAHLNPRLVKALIAVESDFDIRAVSPCGARGLMQVMPRTAAALGVDPALLHRPAPNIGAGTAFLDYLFRAMRARYGLKATRLRDAPPWVQRRVLAAYNAGPRMLFRDQWPKATRVYVGRITRLTRDRKLLLRRTPPAG